MLEVGVVDDFAGYSGGLLEDITASRIYSISSAYTTIRSLLEDDDSQKSLPE